MWGQPASSRRLEVEGSHHRQLVADSSECWAYCAGDEGLSAPFYFSIKEGTSGGVCLCSTDGELVYGSGFQVRNLNTLIAYDPLDSHQLFI